MSGRLADVLDLKRDEERRRAIRGLLRHPLLRADGPDSEAFVVARRHGEWLRRWFHREAGWGLVVEAGVVRLRKVPGTHDDATRGAVAPHGGRAPFSRRRYVLMCLALAALDRSDAQTTLGRLLDRVLALAADPALTTRGVRFTLDNRAERTDLVTVARSLIDLGVLTRVAGDEQSFIDERGDALYDVDRHVLGRLLVTSRGPSLVGAGDHAERLSAITDEPLLDTEETRNRVIRHRIARRLLDDPVLYIADLDDEERAYLATQRGPMLRRLTEGTGFVAEVRAEGIALVDPTGEATDAGMPEEGTDGHATLLLAEQLAARMRHNAQRPVQLDALHATMRGVIAEHRSVWRRSAREPGAERELTAFALRRLESLGLVTISAEGVLGRPALARFAYAEPVVTGRTEA